MTGLLALALLAVFAALLRRRAPPTLDVENLVLVAALWLTWIGLLAVGLASLGWFDAVAMTLGAATIAAITWPWSATTAWRPDMDGRSLAAGAVIVLAGLALRCPTADYALAGRDQGTYTLRAQSTIRTGRLDLVDPVLAAASDAAPERAGPADLLGLYPTRGDAWARDRYEGAYRPGLYLADRERGHVVPQFFHLHPMWMATAGLLAGPAAVAAVIPLQAMLALLGIWAVARRLWPGGPWAALATALVVVAPLSIWVQRTALTEVPATMLLWAAVLAILRDDDRDREAAAMLLGAGAWLRGHGWLMAPIVTAVLWSIPAGRRGPRRAGVVFVVMVVAAVLVHAGSIYPYLHDELGRQLPGDLHPSPGVIIAAAVAGALAWWAADELWAARRRPGPGWRRGPAALVVLLAGALGVWAWARGLTPTRPFSRLDPLVVMIGPVWLATATIGAVRLATVRLTSRPRDVWLLAVGASIVVTAGLYAQRNLPQLGLYYYGRYLAPELLVLAALLATAGIEAVFRRLAGRPWLARSVAAVHAAGLLVSVAAVLVTSPLTRMAEFAGASAVLDHLAARLPPGAIVIAGGEGWHHGHTFNQVGGALALRDGVTVLPYRTREAAYASLHELLVAGPAATGRAAPPVFLLINEATKPYRPDDAGPVAGFDDLLWPPFSAARVDLVELYVDRLTPVTDAVPTRVTRDGLRMGLMQVVVDAERLGDVETYSFGTAWSDDLVITHAKRNAGPLCLRKQQVIDVELPARGGAGDGPVSLVLVAAPGTSVHNHRWRITADGTSLSADLPHAHDRARDTLGPFVLGARPRQLTIRGAPKKVRGAACPRGGIAQLRILGPERAQLRSVPHDAVTFAPPSDLGHPVEPARWVSGRGLSRFRAGVHPTPEIRGLSMVVTPAESLGFPVQALPDEGRSPVDVVVTLSSTRGTAGGATMEVRADARTLGERALPPDRTRSWQSSILTAPALAPATALSIALSGESPDASVDVRDIGLFSRTTPIAGRRAR
jgi:hypothetical protein